MFGTSNGTLDPLVIEDTTSTTSGSGTSGSGTTVLLYKTLTLNYSQPTNFIFFAGPMISLSRSKRVYMAG